MHGRHADAHGGVALRCPWEVIAKCQNMLRERDEEMAQSPATTARVIRTSRFGAAPRGRARRAEAGRAAEGSGKCSRGIGT